MAEDLSFGSWLKQRRKAYGFTQADLAERVDCSLETIYKIEAGQRRPSEQIATLLAGQLGIAPHERAAFVRFARSDIDSLAVDEPLLHAPWRTQFLPPHNLPTQLTSWVGRTSAVANASQLLLSEDTRFVTFVGPPGVGKTRLSIEVGRHVLPRFRDGVFFVPLAAITDRDLLIPAIARVLSIYESTTRDPLDGMKQYLYDREILLILDNFEQVLDAGPLVSELPGACPLLKLVVTSREPLRVTGERRFPVPPLSLPPAVQAEGRRTDQVSESAAIQLFVQRAQAVDPAFEATPDNSEALATLCIQLDGLPLAIEIVSARVAALPLATLVREMRGNQLLQADGWRDVAARHQTLNAAIEWSYQLLDPREQLLFRQLGVFAGGATLEAVDAVCTPVAGGLGSLTSLIDKNLLLSDGSTDLTPRFRMLQTVRDYALWTLTAADELDALQQDYARHFLQWSETAEHALRGHEQIAWVEKVDQEHDNLRAALDYYVKEGDWNASLRMVGALFEFWVFRGYISEGLRRMRHILHATAAVPADPGLRAKALNGAAMLAHFAGDYRAIVPYAEEALTLARKLDNHWSVALACMSLGMSMAGQREFDRAIDIFDTGLTAARHTDEEWLIATLLNGLGEVARSQGDYEQARRLLTSSRELGESCGHKWLVTHVLDNLGHLAHAQQDFGRAMTLYEQSLQASLDIDDQRGVAMCLEKLGGLAAALADAERAARLLGAAEILRERKNAPVEGMDRQDYESFVAAARNGLDDLRFRSAWEEGRQMPLADAVAYALA